MRPGTATSMPEAELVTLPGFSHDIAASRAEARRLLAEAGVPNLAVTLTNRKDVPVPYGAAGEFVVGRVARNRRSGHPGAAQHQGLADGARNRALYRGDRSGCRLFRRSDNTARAIRFARSVADQPLGLDRPLSRRALYRAGAQHRPPATRQDRPRFRAARPERRLYGAAPVVEPHRRHRRKFKGWNMSPSHYIGQDLADVWLEE